LEANIVPPEPTRPIVLDNLTQHDVFREWVRLITEQVNFDSTIIGSGSPEGVESAKKGRQYFDDTGAPSNNRYTKQVDDIAGDTTKGWVLS
jgi:hypothetical protein